ncbi:disease resistance protein RPM1-like [Quercus lobata]|uniref:Disease resistance protein RPM1 n=1 Tax=Quercus lobata TaxID=97700 RepID=A0A7N2KWE9_QUELO|nr:disease resistance protein RPM1-like [Quercus lobata]
MADVAVINLLDKLTSILLQEASLPGDAHDEIEEIKLELESMRSFLKDAERRMERSESVENWVRQVREVAYEAEDIIDEFMHHKDKEKHKSGFKGITKEIVHFPKNITARHQIATKLPKIKVKVHEVSDRSKRYGFDKLDEGTSKYVSRESWQHYAESSIFFGEDEIVGMEEKTEEMIEWLLEDEQRRRIISIVGMGGLGKTTLATRVYNDQRIKQQFNCSAWISVTQMHDSNELLRSMVREFFETKQLVLPNNFGTMNNVQLMAMLFHYLHQKRYVVVLDDVWDIYLWSSIRGAFPDNKNGSRIILTTRNENVATSVGVGYRLNHLEPLQEKDAWPLFCKKAFWNEPGHCCPQELQPLAHAIVNKCEGLPLAIVAIGGLMCSRSKAIGEWKKVYESLNWQLSYNPKLGQVKGMLLLSYKDLPFYLKHCFLYCCMFHYCSQIKRKKLIRLWVAEGFVKERKGNIMEEVAEEHLTDLILRSMIQVTETNAAGRVKTCRVHDVMHELAMTISEKENFCTAYDGNESRLEGNFHHLSVHDRGEKIRLSRPMSHHLRSFFVFKTDMCSSFSLDAALSKFKLLRVLNLQGVPVETIPSTLGRLFNLRYLNLRDTKISELPKSTKKLRNLQTLDVWNTNVRRLPSGISKLTRLRHLYMYCNNNQNSETSNIANGMLAPTGLWNIQCLQTLACIDAEEELIQQVGNLTELRRLDITKLKTVHGPKLCTSIQKMKNLLRLCVTATNEEELQLESLSLPPSYLQKLELVGRLNRLPHWFGSLSNLTHLFLGRSYLQDDMVFPLHILSALVFLELKKAYNGKLLHFKAKWFPKLNKLKIVELAQLDSLVVEEGALPTIQELNQIRCLELKALPQGVEHLISLQKLHLEEMPEEFIQMLRNDKKHDQSKVCHIPTIKLACLNGQSQVVETLC